MTIDPNEEQHRGQMRFAERFCSRFRGRLLHAHGIGWHEWDGTRWAACKDGAPLRAVETLARDAYADLGFMRGSDDEKKAKRKALLQDIGAVSSASGANGVLTLAGSLTPCTIAGESVDVRPELFNTESGTVNLTSREIYPPDPKDHLTRRASAAFDPEARCDEWDGFLETIQPDRDVREFLQRIFGLAMFGAVREHVLPIFIGTGANGKGMLRSAVMAAFGDYAREVDPELLMESKHPRHLTFLMELKSMRLVFASETTRNRRFDESTMKRLVGGDPIQANRMRHDPITFEPSHTLIMVTNHLPVVSGDDPAVWRRLLVVPFEVTIGDDEQDPELPDRLRGAQARAAVMAWVWQGWLTYLEAGLQTPEAVVKRTDQYRTESDSLGNFLAEMTTETPQGHARAGDLFAAWTAWCAENGVAVGSQKAFSTSLSNRGFLKQTKNIGAVYQGVELYSSDTDADKRLL
jgi:putative DNA primase/helicase